MPLVTANQYDLVPQFSNIGTGAAQGYALGSQFKQRQQQEQQLAAQQAQKQQISQFTPQALAGDKEAMSKIAGLDSDLALNLQKIMAGQDEATNKEMIRENENMTRGAIGVLEISGGDPAKARVALQNLERQWANQGLKTNLTKGALALDDEVMMQALNQQATQGLAIDDYAKSVLGVKEPVSPLDQAKIDELKAKTAQIGKAEPVSQLDQAKIDKLEAETIGIKSAPSTLEAPKVLLEGLSPTLAPKANAAFVAAGGGDKGMRAMAEVIDTGTEQERRANSSSILASSFPQADESELRQLQGVMDSAKTTEEGLKEAGKVREQQRQDKIALSTKERAISIIDKLFSNDELDDVIGSVEGSDESVIPFGGEKYRSDKESEAIADIQELESILTADSLGLMSGVLSESDIKILKNIAAGGLNRKRGEDRFRSDLNQIKSKLSLAKPKNVTSIEDLVNKYAN